MAYRNGTYVAFHADGTSDPTESDMKYYRLLTAWSENKNNEFRMIDSHEKTSAVRDMSKREILRRRLIDRMKKSKNMILIIGATTRYDTDWVPFEIEYAVDTCKIPIIAAYPGYGPILSSDSINHINRLWPNSLRIRINNSKARVIHVPFKREPIMEAIGRFGPNSLPSGGRSCWPIAAYRRWGCSPKRRLPTVYPSDRSAPSR